MPGRLTLGLTLNLLMGPEDLLPFFGAAIYVGLFDPGPEVHGITLYTRPPTLSYSHTMSGDHKKRTSKGPL